MAQEQEKEPVQLTHVGLDLHTGVVSLFGARSDELVRFRFFLPPGLQQLLSTQPWTEQAVRTLLVTGQAEPGAPTSAESERSPAFYGSAAVDGTFSMADLTRARLADQPVAPTAQEKNPTLVVPGRLQTKPQDGRPDRQGKPTAWAHLLGHIEGRDGATLLSTSFHGRTREIALALDKGDQITAQGYIHWRRADAPEDRLSTFSVIHLIHYRGEPQRGQLS
jgi:hypothetical protein